MFSYNITVPINVPTTATIIHFISLPTVRIAMTTKAIFQGLNIIFSELRKKLLRFIWQLIEPVRRICTWIHSHYQHPAFFPYAL